MPMGPRRLVSYIYNLLKGGDPPGRKSKMRVAIVFLLVGIVLISLVLQKAAVQLTRATIDLHIHDTYVVIDWWHFINGVLLICLLFFSLGGVIGTGFKSKAFNSTLLVTLLLIGGIIWCYYGLFTK